jgi:two-component sensor histidine kinase/streptogramin lyase
LDELYDGGTPQFTKHKNVGGSIINQLYEDRLGNIWVGLFDMHLSKYDRQHNPFIWYRRIPGNPNSLSSSGIECIYVDQKDNIWFGHHFGGLTKLDRATGAYTRYTPDHRTSDGISSNWISSICEDSDGMLWFGTFDAGIDILNPSDGSFRHITADSNNTLGLSSNKIHFLLKASSGDIWVSTLNEGLQLYDHEKKHFISFDVDSSTSDDEETTRLYEDRRGTLWIGTMNNGLYGVTIEDRQITKVKHYVHNPNDKTSVSNNCITDIIQSKVLDNTTLWIATGVGLNKLDLKTETFTHYFKEDGLPHNMVLKVLDDDEGNIWASTPYELCVYNVATGNFSSYGKDDGLPLTGFGGGRQNSAVTVDRQLLFGSANGALGFYPEAVVTNPNIPHMRLTDFKILHKSARLDTAITFKHIINLNHDQNTFAFEFTDLNFSSSKRNQFAYKLEGLHDDWVFVGQERVASFTDIGPGRYIFHVKGSNDHGIWNKDERSLVIIITPPWWATWWFRAILFVTVIGILYSIYRYRLYKAVEMERLRVRIASDLHDDIGSTLTKIVVQSEVIQSSADAEKIKTFSKQIGAACREIISTLSDIVWSIDARNDTIGNLLDRMRDFTAEVFASKQIEFRLSHSGLETEKRIPVDTRQNIYLVFKEAVNNSARHSNASNVWISLKNNPDQFTMSITDDGQGIPGNPKHTGHGLRNMRMRAERIGGNVQVVCDNGTKVILTMKAL